jgi:hypothetical protein
MIAKMFDERCPSNVLTGGVYFCDYTSHDSPYSLSATVLWTRQTDPDDLVDDFMSTVVRAPVHGVSVVNTTACRKLLHNAITHAVKCEAVRLFPVSGGDGMNKEFSSEQK